MKKTVMFLLVLMLMLIGSKTNATTINLDFSSGTYDSSNSLYTEDGFTVEASHGFYGIRLNTLAWYEGDNLITISSGGDLFDLEHLTVVDTAYAGLMFNSSNGGSLSVGGISGLLNFPGEEWDAIEYFTITTTIHSDILNEIDDISLTTIPLQNPVPEPTSILLFGSGLICLSGLRKRLNKSTTPRLKTDGLAR